MYTCTYLPFEEANQYVRKVYYSDTRIHRKRCFFFLSQKVKIQKVQKTKSGSPDGVLFYSNLYTFPRGRIRSAIIHRGITVDISSVKNKTIFAYGTRVVWISLCSYGYFPSIVRGAYLERTAMIYLSI